MAVHRKTIAGRDVSVIVTPAARPLSGQRGYVADGFVAGIRTDGAPDPLFGEFLKNRVFATEAEACDAAFDEIEKRLIENSNARGQT